jgi:hypothetical protein
VLAADPARRMRPAVEHRQIAWFALKWESLLFPLSDDESGAEHVLAELVMTTIATTRTGACDIQSDRFE